MMKRFLTSTLAIILCASFGFSSTAYAYEIPETIDSDTCIITVTGSDDILDFLNSEYNDPNIKYSFFTPSPIQPRAICYMCGKNGMGLGTMEDQISSDLRFCVDMSGGSDLVSEWGVFQVERCTFCQYRVKLYQISSTWRVLCLANNRTWNIIPGATMEQGYEPHECIIP